MKRQKKQCFKLWECNLRLQRRWAKLSFRLSTGCKTRIVSFFRSYYSYRQLFVDDLVEDSSGSRGSRDSTAHMAPTAHSGSKGESFVLDCCIHLQTPLDTPKKGQFSNCESVTLDYTEKEPSSTLGYLPAAVPGFCHSFGHWWWWNCTGWANSRW